MALKKKSYAVIGCGRFGRSLAVKLEELGQEVMIVDSNKEIVDDMAEIVDLAIEADVTQDGALDGIGLSNVDVAIVAMSGDFEASVMAVAICREKGITQITAKAQNMRHSHILKLVGATKTVQPERVAGISLANNLVGNTIYDHLKMSDAYSIKEFPVPDTWVGKTIMELDIRKRLDMNIIALQQGDDMDISPTPNQVLQADQSIFALGPNEAFDGLEEWMRAQ